LLGVGRVENFHERLKSLRVKQNLTQQELADKLFVSRQAVSNWENDKNFPDLKSVVLLSDLLQVSLDDFLKGEKALTKHMEKNLKKNDSFKLIGLIFMLVPAFLVPIAGLAFSFFVLKNDRKFNYPSWSKYAAIVAVFFQIIMIGIIILSIPTSTEQFDHIKNTLETP